MKAPLNFKLMAHPMNYIVILLMLVIAGAAGHMLLSLVSVEPSTGKSFYDNLPAGQTPATS